MIKLILAFEAAACAQSHACALRLVAYMDANPHKAAMLTQPYLDTVKDARFVVGAV